MPIVDPPTRPIGPDALWAETVKGYRAVHGTDTDDRAYLVENEPEESKTSVKGI